jgi:5-methylcytosine-specific restriction endonuclease McrA
MNNYQQRNDNLRSIGFTSYKSYLSSGLWKGIRDAILARDCRNCVRCGFRAWQVHHLSYDVDVLLGKRPGKLISVCDDCHRKAERNQDGSKTPHKAANIRLVGIKPSNESSKLGLLVPQGRWIKGKTYRQNRARIDRD